MIADAECLKIIHEVLKQLELGKFVIKVNDRRILDGVFAICGCPDDKFRGACSAVDKLDKLPWEDVKCEMLEKGLTEESADKIGHYVQMAGGKDEINDLLKDEALLKSKCAVAGLKDMKLMFEYLEAFEMLNEVSFDLSLARGLDYYTGAIYEAVLQADPNEEQLKNKGETVGVASIAGGGRYDGLVGSFDPKGKSVPCVGMSIGIERIFSIIEAKFAKEKKAMRTNETQVYVASPQKGFLQERMKILNELWSSNIKAEMSYKNNPKMLKQLQDCEESGIPDVVVIASGELESGTVKIRNVVSREETTVARGEMVTKLLDLLSSQSSS
jgi:histidyl-tRNA synthetase